MIWLEKPPTSNLEELQSLMEIRRAHDEASTILVNFQRRFGEPFRTLQKLVQNQTLGDLVSIYVTYSKGLLVNGSHYVDLVFFLIGDRLSWRLVYTVPEPDRENPCFGLRFENGIMAVFTGLVLPYHCVDLNLVFSEGRASVLYGGMETRMEIRVEHELFPGFYRLKEADRSWYEGDIPHDDHMSNALSDLITAYEEGRDTMSNLSTAKNTMAVLESVNGAIRDVQ
jgi:predicted dehydrogenase